MVVLEKITAPASRNRAAGGASVAAGTSLVVAAPSGVGTPLVAMLSLIVAGTPSSEPIGSPFCQRSVDNFAVARAPSGSNAYSALICGSHTAICASTSCSTSAGENWLARNPERQADGAEIVQRRHRFLRFRFMHGHLPAIGFR